MSTKYQWYVAINSWAGLTRHRVEIVKICEKRIRVRWLDHAPGHSVGSESYPPKYSLCRLEDGHWIKWTE
jgi:hypothetical protein